jgi:hypothetical protein
MSISETMTYMNCRVKKTFRRFLLHLKFIKVFKQIIYPWKRNHSSNLNLLTDVVWNKTGIYKINISPLLYLCVLLKLHYLNLFFLHVFIPLQLISYCINYFFYISCMYISVATSCTGTQHPILIRKAIASFSPRKYERHCRSHNSHTPYYSLSSLNKMTPLWKSFTENFVVALLVRSSSFM